MKFELINKIILSSFVASASAYDLLKDYAGDLKVGVAANAMRFSNSNYVNAMKAFNMMVAENDCKLSGIQQQKGVYNFNGCDNHYNKAKELGMEFRGHCLIWHSYQPSWFENADANTLKNAIVDHITKVLQHYEGKIKYWDVVNEAIDDGSNGNGWNMRRSFLYNKVPNFVDLAFQTARKVSPNTKLFYNDYNAEGHLPKSESIYNFVADLKKRNLPIDGVGLQYLVSAQSQPTYDKINNLIGRYCKLGLEVHITELDVKLQGNQNGQTQAYTNALKACLANSCCKAFLVWGVGDNDSWLGANEQALLFNGNYQPKPLYNSVLDVLKKNARPASANNGNNSPAAGAPAGNSKATKTIPQLRTKTIPANLVNGGNGGSNSKTIPSQTDIPKTKVLPTAVKRTKTVPQSLISKTKTLPNLNGGGATKKTKTLPNTVKSLPSKTKTLPNIAGGAKTLPSRTKTLPANAVAGSKTLPNLTNKTKTIPQNLVSKTKTLPNLTGGSKTLPSKTKTLPNIAGGSKTLPNKTKTLPNIAGGSKTLPSKTKTLPNIAGGSKTLPSKTKTLPNIAGGSKTLPNKTKTLPNTAAAGSKTLPSKTKTLPNIAGGSKTLPNKTKTLPNTAAGNAKTLPSKTKTLPNIAGGSKTLPNKTKTLPNTAAGNAKTLPNKTKTLPNIAGGSKTLPKTKTLPNVPKTKTLPSGGNNGNQCEPTTVTVTVTITSNSVATGGNDGNCVPKWGQCGGINYNGPKCCQSGSTCKEFNEWYHQCV